MTSTNQTKNGDRSMPIKDTTRAKREGTQGRTKTVNLKLNIEEGYGRLVESWKKEGTIYAALLASRECPDAFRQAFANIFTDHLLAVCKPTHPCYIKAFFPLAALALEGDEPATVDAVVNVLRTLRETLAPELTEKILAGLSKN
jgi:hypothetical protein